MPRRPARRALPKIPKHLELPTGRADIVTQEGLLENEQSAGKFDWPSRTITLDASLKASAAWLTLRHERVHIVLMDAGINVPEELEERICDAIAAADVADMVREITRSTRS